MHQFVMGLSEVRFGGICQSIISSDSELDIREIYAKVIKEEQRLNSAKERESQQNATGFLAKIEEEQTASHTNSAILEDDHSALTAEEHVTIKQTVGSWSDFLIDGKNVQRKTEVGMEEIEAALEEVVVAAPLDRTDRVIRELVSIMLTPPPPTHRLFQVLLKNNGQLLLT